MKLTILAACAAAILSLVCGLPILAQADAAMAGSTVTLADIHAAAVRK